MNNYQLGILVQSAAEIESYCFANSIGLTDAIDLISKTLIAIREERPKPTTDDDNTSQHLLPGGDR